MFLDAFGSKGVVLELPPCWADIDMSVSSGVSVEDLKIPMEAEI